MSEKVFVKNILTDSDFPFFSAGINQLERGNYYYRELNLIANHEIKSYLDCLPYHLDAEQPLILGSNEIIAMAAQDDFITGIAVSEALGDATSFIENADFTSESTSNANANASATGINNVGIINTKKGNDIIIGIGLATADSKAIAESEAILTSNSIANATAIANGIGIKNSGSIDTGEGNDAIVGIGNVIAQSIATTQADSTGGSGLVATATSTSVATTQTLAIGIENLGSIFAGKGHDLITGVANNWSVSSAEAEAFAQNTVALLTAGYDPAIMGQLETAIANSAAASTALSLSQTIGIANPNLIHTSNGHDFIFGLATNTSSSEALTVAAASATAADFATATADAVSLATTEGIAVGIANQGRVSTGRGDDTVMGIALRQVNADADADVEDVLAQANVPDAQANSNSVADTAQGFAIGIDNTTGIIKTDFGNDQVIGYGEIGIQGGRILTGKHHDHVIAYGSEIGFQDGKVRLGNGDDYFQAAIANLDPFTGEITFAEQQAGAIKNAVISGGNGNDTFELGGFSEAVTIDGGEDYDVFRLAGSLEGYQITLGAAELQELEIKSDDGMVTVKNVEALYFSHSDYAYSYADFGEFA